MNASDSRRRGVKQREIIDWSCNRVECFETHGFLTLGAAFPQPSCPHCGGDMSEHNRWRLVVAGACDACNGTTTGQFCDAHSWHRAQ